LLFDLPVDAKIQQAEGAAFSESTYNILKATENQIIQLKQKTRSKTTYEFAQSPSKDITCSKIPCSQQTYDEIFTNIKGSTGQHIAVLNLQKGPGSNNNGVERAICSTVQKPADQSAIVASRQET
jgi:hypothetical protein